MPRRQFDFAGAKFTPEVIAEALGAFSAEARDKISTSRQNVQSRADEGWDFDTIEEFYAEYRKDVHRAHLTRHHLSGDDVSLYFYGPYYFDDQYVKAYTSVSVQLETRAQVERVFGVFEDAAPTSLLPIPITAPERPTIFIGHGRSMQWRDLSDHLRDHQKLQVTAYESEPRAGGTIKEILQEMASKASFAILVHAAEDEQADASLRARENVVHETGLFQGRLGFDRVLILREQGCEPFSNIAGTQEIRYSPNNIRETYGDVVAVIRRQFPDLGER